MRRDARRPPRTARRLPGQARLRRHLRALRRRRRHADAATASSCSATGPAGSTTTCGSRSTACWSAGRCRRARRSTPTSRRMAVHVEDHPLDYFDFEGVIPAGEYGGGDVIVWDWGTWDPAEGRRPAGRRSRPATSTSTCTARSCAAASCSCAAAARRQGAVAAAAQARRRTPSPGWDPEDHPRSVKSGRTNDEVEGGAGGARWTRRRASIWDRSRTDDELAALDALGKQGEWRLRRPHACSSPTSTRCCSRRRDGEAAADQARPDPPPRRDRAGDAARTSPTGRSTCTASPTASTSQGFWHKAVPSHAPDWLTRWHNDGRGPGRDRAVPRRSTRPPRWRGLANYGAIELHPWTSTVDATRTEPTWAMIDIDPGDRQRPSTTCSCSPGCTAPPSSTSACGRAQGDRQARHPDLGAGRRRATRSTTPGPGSRALSRAVGDDRARAGELGVEEVEARRPGPPRLHAERHQQDARRAVQRPARAGAPVSVPIAWDELDDPDLRPDRWTIRTVLERLADVGRPAAPR